MNSLSEIHVVIADDHPIVRSGIIRELSKKEGISVVGEATDGDEVLNIIQRRSPDILLLDINMPGKKALPLISEIQQYVFQEIQFAYVFI